MLPKLFTVSELTRRIKENLEAGFPEVWVEGEISNYLLHTSGHRYFSLKDESAQVRCVFWRRQARLLRFEPEDGMKVQIYGNLTVYEKQGQYQLNVLRILPKGRGELELAFQQLKEKLFREGLFDEARKRPLPRFPEAIGIVTSPTGAAIRDLIEILTRRYPPAQIILYPARVQGEDAGEEIEAGIKAFNRHGEADLIIVGRGGGSLEDLWAFNEERVARAIFHSRIPVVSAVGHEIDYTIADFVADLRAPTPSAAAELVVPEQGQLLAGLRGWLQSLVNELERQVETRRERVVAIGKSYGFRRPLDFIAQRAQEVDEALRVLKFSASHRLDALRGHLALLTGKLDALSPLAVFQRGYAMVLKLPERSLVREARVLQREDQVEVKVFKGRFQARVEETNVE